MKRWAVLLLLLWTPTAFAQPSLTPPAAAPYAYGPQPASPLLNPPPDFGDFTGRYALGGVIGAHSVLHTDSIAAVLGARLERSFWRSPAFLDGFRVGLQAHVDLGLLAGAADSGPGDDAYRGLLFGAGISGSAGYYWQSFGMEVLAGPSALFDNTRIGSGLGLYMDVGLGLTWISPGRHQWFARMHVLGGDSGDAEDLNDDKVTLFWTLGRSL